MNATAQPNTVRRKVSPTNCMERIAKAGQHRETRKAHLSEVITPALHNALERPILEQVGLRQDLRGKNEAQDQNSARATPGQRLAGANEDIAQPRDHWCRVTVSTVLGTIQRSRSFSSVVFHYPPRR